MIFQVKKYIKRCRAAIRACRSGKDSDGKKGIRILMYHSVGGRPQDHRLAIRVPAESFERELRQIADSGYKTFTVSELAEGVLDKPPRNGIAITFDDGYKDNALTAAFMLKEMNLKATFFVTTSYIDGSVRKEWRNGAPREFMTWDDIIRLSGMGFEIGSHMVRHVDLTSLTEAELRFELEGSRDIISRHTGKAVYTYSYPYGNVNQAVVEMARTCGYKAGCSSFYGWNAQSTNRYILKRTEIDGYDIINDFIGKLYGYYD